MFTFRHQAYDREIYLIFIRHLKSQRKGAKKEEKEEKKKVGELRNEIKKSASGAGVGQRRKRDKDAKETRADKDMSSGDGRAGGTAGKRFTSKLPVGKAGERLCARQRDCRRAF